MLGIFLSVEQKSRTEGATSFPWFFKTPPQRERGVPFGVGQEPITVNMAPGWGDDGGGTSDQECYNCHSVFLYQLAYAGDIMRLIHILELSYKGKIALQVFFRVRPFQYFGRHVAFMYFA